MQAGLQVGAQLRQRFLVAGLAGEGVIEGGQLPRLELKQADGELGLAAGGLLLRVRVRECAAHGAAFPQRHAEDPLHEPGDHPFLLQLDLHAVAAAAADRFAAVDEGAGEAHLGHIAVGGDPTFDGHQGGHLAAGLFDQFVDSGGVVGHRLHLRLQPAGAPQRGGGLHVELEGEGERLPGLEAIQHRLEALAELGTPQGGDLHLPQGLAERAIHQILQCGGPDPQGADLLQQHRPGHPALAEARQAHAPAQLLKRDLVAGTAAAPRHVHLQRHTAGGARRGVHRQRLGARAGARRRGAGLGLGLGGGRGAGAGGRTHGPGLGGGAAPNPRKWPNRRSAAYCSGDAERRHIFRSVGPRSLAHLLPGPESTVPASSSSSPPVRSSHRTPVSCFHHRLPQVP